MQKKRSRSEFSAPLILTALGVSLTPLLAQSPGSFKEDFSGRGLTGVERFQSVRWDKAVHVRRLSNWFQLEPMQAAHGADGSPPPATHRIDAYEDTVYAAREHLMTAINAETYGVVYLTPNALADFHDGECVLRFDLSTLRTTRRDWIDVWLTPWEDNMQLPLEDDLPDLQGNPRRGIQIRMDLWNTFYAGKQVDWTHFQATRYDNYQPTQLPHDVDGYEKFVTPSARQRQTFEVRISKTRLRVGMPSLNLWWIDTPLTSLGYDRAVVQFGHHSYNPLKSNAAPLGHDTSLAGTGNPSPMSWHWDDFEITPALRFDIIHADRRFVIGSDPQPVRFDRPAPADAFLRFSALGTVEVSFDSGPFQAAGRQDGSLEAQGKHADDHFASYWMPVPAGTQQVEFRIRAEGVWAMYRLETMAKDFAIWSLPVGGVGCVGTGGVTPQATHPAPAIGNQAFGIQVTQARAGAPAVMVLSAAEVEAPSCTPAVSLDPASGAMPFFRRVSPLGQALVSLPIPNLPTLVGTAVFAQWIIEDPAGGYSPGGLRYALSPLRRVIIQ